MRPTIALHPERLPDPSRNPAHQSAPEPGSGPQAAPIEASPASSTLRRTCLPSPSHQRNDRAAT
jgi:hypothetical protein